MAMYKRLGYAGVCITDHFSGSTHLPNDMPWRDRVLFHQDVYRKAKKAGEGLDVFYGFEFSYLPDPRKFNQGHGTDFIILGIDGDWMLGNEAAFRGELTALLDGIRDAGGLVIHAHPFKQARWIPHIRLFPSQTDAVEVQNGSTDATANTAANAYADTYGFHKTGGSDIHYPGHQTFCGVEVDYRCATVDELVAAIRGRQARPFGNHYSL
jgi:hypothetical protein